MLVICLAGCVTARRADSIGGTITAALDGQHAPISDAQVTIRPASSAFDRADEAPEDPRNLRAVALTDASGGFVVATMASDQTFAEYGLLRGWTYEVRIDVPGYWTYRGTITWARGAGTLSIQLKKKDDLDVRDPTDRSDGVLYDAAWPPGQARPGPRTR